MGRAGCNQRRRAEHCDHSFAHRNLLSRHRASVCRGSSETAAAQRCA
jgi:hypothetical protein